MLKGTITKWNAPRGFGFIENDETGQRVFCHLSRVLGLDADYLTPGTRVTYVEGISKRTNEPEAKNVQVIERCSVASDEW